MNDLVVRLRSLTHVELQEFKSIMITAGIVYESNGSHIKYISDALKDCSTDLKVVLRCVKKLDFTEIDTIITDILKWRRK